MKRNQTDQRTPAIAWRRVVGRALVFGPLAATMGFMVGAVCGAVLCLADGAPWAFALWWSLRGLCGGLAAGAIMGAVSGIYHVEETAPAANPSRKASVPHSLFGVAARPLLTYRRNVARPGN
ncbi:MAG TPA: hypothetical protein VMS17_02055 [Gemmataceae bacterium]|nr:hypothetical protein [Gemmataceae bacterium]